jgi:hypothetical protein
MIGSPFQDSVSGHWSDTRQGVELRSGCGVQVQLRRRAGTATARRARAPAARRSASSPTIAHFATWISSGSDQDLLTIDDDLGKVEIARFRGAAEASSGIDGIRDSGAVGKLHQAWPADRAQDVHHDLRRRR